jgi:hypothetical protein
MKLQQKVNRLSPWPKLLPQAQADEDVAILIITCDATWVYVNDVEEKQQ